MRGNTIRLTIALSQSDLELIENAASRTGVGADEFVRYAALRMARQDVTIASGAAPERDSPPLPSRRSLRPVIERATVPTIDIVRQLGTHLGVQLLAMTVGAQPQEIERWASETAEPSSVHERRLREAHEAWQLVVSVESPKTTRAWWMGMQDGLDDLSPAEAIAQDRAGDVMAVARYFLEAG